MDEFHAQGLWWREDTSGWVIGDPVPDSAVAGILSVDAGDGGTLEMIGMLSEWGEQPKSVRIFGVTTDGNRVTLQARFSSESFNTATASFRTDQYYVERAYVGDFIAEGTTFWRLSFSIDQLPQWTNFRGLDASTDSPLTVDVAKTAEAVIDDADIILRAYEDDDSAIPKPPSKAFINVYPETPLTFSEFDEQYLQPLRNLVTLGVGEGVFPEIVTVYTQRYGPQESRVKIYRRIPYHRTPDERSSPQMAFILSDIDFQTAVESWLTSVNRVPKFHNRYFGRKYNQEMFLDSEFLSLIVGLELYHREMYPSGSYMSDKVWEKVRDSFLARIPEVAAKKRITDLIMNIGNRYSLGDRLRDIVSDHEEIIASVFDPQSAVSDAVGARIDLAHGTDHEEMDREELHRRKEQVDVIATACLLSLVGIESEKRKEIILDLYHH